MIFFVTFLANTATEVSSEVKVGIDIFVPSQKYQLKPLSTSWFASACAVAIAPGSTFFDCSDVIVLIATDAALCALAIIVNMFSLRLCLH